MQVLKEEIRSSILKVAKRQFLENGYADTSVRSIASAAGVGVSNMYNYFLNKDVLLQEVLRPLTVQMEVMLQSNHGHGSPVDHSRFSEEYYRKCTDDYLQLWKKHKSLMAILLFRSQGSSMEDYLDSYVEHSAKVTSEWLRRLKEENPEVNTDISYFTVRLHSVWMITFLKEIILNNLKEPQIREAMSEYVKFEIEGWKAILRL